MSRPLSRRLTKSKRLLLRAERCRRERPWSSVVERSWEMWMNARARHYVWVTFLLNDIESCSGV